MVNRDPEQTKGRGKALCIFILLLCALPFHSPAFGEDRLSAILEGVRAYYGDLPGLTVSYERDILTRSMALLGQEIKGDLASGFIHFKPPHYLRVEQKAPTQEDVITDGQTLWWVLPEKNLVYRYPSDKLGKELKILADIFRGLRDIEASFEISLKAYGVEGQHKIELMPNPPWPEVDHIVVTIDQETSLIRRVDIADHLGGRTRFTLGPLTVRNHFEKNFFTFKIPKGMKVIQEEGG